MAKKTKAPAFGGLDRSKTLAENTVNAGPVVLDSNVTLKNPDGTGFQGGSLTVKLAKAGADDHLSIAEVGGITLKTDAGTGITSVFYNGVRIGTETVSGSTITVSFDQPAGDDAATALARAIAYSNPSNTPSAAAHAVTFTAVDAEHSSISATMQLKVKAEKDAPVFSNLGPGSSHTPASATGGVVIDGDAHVANADGTGFKGGKLTVHMDGATATDQLYLASGSFSVSGTKLMLNGKQVGTVSADGASGHDLAFTFKSNVAVSDAQMSALMDQVSYRSTAPGSPATPHDVTFTVTDAEKSAAAAHVGLAFENQAPTILSSSPAGGIIRVSVTASGQQGQGASLEPIISPDGTKLAFGSSAANLYNGADTGRYQILVKDLSTGSITLASASASGSPANMDTPIIYSSADMSFSLDGHKLLFTSLASNLSPNDTNNYDDVFLKDIETGAIIRVSTDSSGSQISGGYYPSFSPDNTKVVFKTAPNLPGDTNGSGLYVKDLTTGSITQLIINKGDGYSGTAGSSPTFSNDGTKIAFVSFGNSSGPNDVGGSICIYVKDLSTGDVTYVSAANSHQVRPVFSPDGTKIAFVSNESSVVPGGELGGTHLYVKDLQTGEITRVSSPGEVLPNDGVVGDQFAFSADGTKIVFSSSESTMPGNTNGTSNIFVADLETGAITKVAANTTGISTGLAFTPDGAHVIFASDATDLVAKDTNGATDVFMASIPATSVTSATLTEDAARKTLNAAGTFYFADADAKDTHAVSVAAPDGALGTLSAKVVSDMNGSGAVVWSYVVDETKVEPLAAGQTKVETFALTLDDHHGGTVTQNVSVTLTGTGGVSPMVASFALAPETTAAPASGPDLWAAAMAQLSGVSALLPGLSDLLESRLAALEAAHAHGPADATEGTGAALAHLAAHGDPAIAHILETLWSDASGHGAGTASAHAFADGIEALSSHLLALHGGADSCHLLV